ncbi:MAG TPA: hypothetical protein VES00_06230 [Burkholderiaceae bacterium]|jgi:hypothetical protein|nr:hypothetical protein [Burkholderiaceae bacterium]
MTSTRLFLATAVLVLAAPLVALAQAGNDSGPPPDQGGRDHRGPPPEAIAACKGKAIGTQASFTDRGGRTVSGPCTQMGDVVAVPPPQRGRGPQGGASQSSQ